MEYAIISRSLDNFNNLKDHVEKWNKRKRALHISDGVLPVAQNERKRLCVYCSDGTFVANGERSRAGARRIILSGTSLSLSVITDHMAPRDMEHSVGNAPRSFRISSSSCAREHMSNTILFILFARPYIVVFLLRSLNFFFPLN